MATVRKIRPIIFSKNVRIVFSSSFCIESLRPVSHCSEVVKVVVQLENAHKIHKMAIHWRRNVQPIGNHPGSGTKGGYQWDAISWRKFLRREFHAALPCSGPRRKFLRQEFLENARFLIPNWIGHILETQPADHW